MTAFTRKLTAVYLMFRCYPAHACLLFLLARGLA